MVSAATSSAVGGSPSASVPPLNPAVLLQAIAVRPGEVATGTVALGVTDVASEAGLATANRLAAAAFAS